MKRSIAFALITIYLTFLTAFSPTCSKVQEKIEQMKPEIRGVTLDWGAITPATTEVIGTIKVYNPNSISLDVKNIAYSVNMDGISMANAESPGLQIEKNAEFLIKISAKIDNTKIPEFWAEHIKRNEKSEAAFEIKPTFDLKVTDFTYPFKLNRPIETNLLSSLNKVGPIPLEKKVKVPLIGEKTIFKAFLDSLFGNWGTITPQTTQINLAAIILNQNSYPLVSPKMEYKMEMNNITVGTGESGLQLACAPNSKGDIKITALLNTGVMDKWFVSHIQQGEKSTFKMSIALVFDVPAFDKVSIPIWESSKDFETDILGKINQ